MSLEVKAHKEACVCADCRALDQYRALFDAVNRDAVANMLGLGAFRCRKKLANGTVITVSIKNPERPSQPSSDVRTAESNSPVRTSHPITEGCAPPLASEGGAK